ncbi:MAG: aldolase catalytic domain-containing protein [Clostridium celatum]|nr:aldolase catalytic domain-containing protein [Clostridium celatum]
MGKIKILDCTLRDGGYVNEWRFGARNISRIINKLSQANIDIIECGFLTSKGGDVDTTLFNDVSKIKGYIKSKNKGLMYVAMIAYPNKIVENIPICDGSSIDGIRVTFHEHEIQEAMDVCEELIKKGYKVFIQPVGVTSYSDSNLIKLIDKVNLLMPYAFYMVDTLGKMYKNDLLRMFYLIDNNLEKDINIGFHSHNNLQLSFSNAQELMSLHTKRTIIIDSSVFGMGRGAGNLCTELVAQYINDNIEKNYNIENLLEIIDEQLNTIYSKYPWGYSAPYCLAAINNCHPNYASHLIDKQTISVKSISDILRAISDDKRTIYDKNYIEEIYMQYQKHYIDDEEELQRMKEEVDGKRVLILAPGKSIESCEAEVKKFIEDYNPYIISINFVPKNIEVDCIFISNFKRFDNIFDVIESIDENIRVVITSNITVEKQSRYSIINYTDLLVDNQVVSDNAGLMLINLLKRLLIKDVFIAGFDGYTVREKNYVGIDMEFIKSKEQVDELNINIKEVIQRLSRNIEIKFITKSKYK